MKLQINNVYWNEIKNKDVFNKFKITIKEQIPEEYYYIYEIEINTLEELFELKSMLKDDLLLEYDKDNQFKIIIHDAFLY